MFILRKIKRPAGIFSFEGRAVTEDEHGAWLYIPRGSEWKAPHDVGLTAVDNLVLLNPKHFWVAWWTNDPADKRIEVDICLPPEREDNDWTYVDLELDPVCHAGGTIEIQDRDEFDGACRNGWISPEHRRLALETALAMESVLRGRIEPFGDEGWTRLNGFRSVIAGSESV